MNDPAAPPSSVPSENSGSVQGDGTPSGDTDATTTSAANADAEGSTSPPSRRRGAWVWKGAVPIVMLVAGGMFGVSSRAAQGTDLRSETTNLADVVRRADNRVKVKQENVAALRTEVEKAQLAAAKRDTGAARALELTKRADKAQDSAGLAPMSGQSLTVTLDDSKQKVEDLPKDGSPDWLVVHQQDVQAVVNALWASGARGIELMDQRIVSTSAVRCVGNTLILQGRVYSPPFTITAVGDPVKMKAGLDADPAVTIYKQYVDLVGLGYDVKTSQNTTLPAFTGSVTMKHAHVAR